MKTSGAADGSVAQPRVIRSRATLRKLLGNDSAIRRWYVARVFRQEPAKETRLATDLLFAPATAKLYRDLELSANETDIDRVMQALSKQKRDKLSWWQGEDFDHRVHLSVRSFRKLFAYPKDPVEEGMVFVEVAAGGKSKYLPFTYQARKESKRVFDKLLNPRAQKQKASR